MTALLIGLALVVVAILAAQWWSMRGDGWIARRNATGQASRFDDFGGRWGTHGHSL
jgi:hypothetical protein